MRRLVVVGGGIAGLAAAWTARRSSPGDLEVILLEREPRVGGKAQSLTADGWLVEAGPGAFLGGRATLDRLIADAGLASDLLDADPAAARRFVLHRGRIRRIALDPIGFARSGILSPAGLIRMLREP